MSKSLILLYVPYSPQMEIGKSVKREIFHFFFTFAIDNFGFTTIFVDFNCVTEG